MAQRLRSCSKTTNFETINCESYLNSLMKDNPVEQSCVQKRSCFRSQSLGRPKPSSTMMFLPATPPNLKSRPGTFKQQNILSNKAQSNHSNVIHKEVIGDNSALVEVTVRTHTNRKSHKTTEKKEKQRQPWATLLQSSQDHPAAVSSFAGFDPLRTLHFLGRELNSALKLHTNCDASVLKIVTEMLNALNCVPPEVVSNVGFQHKNDTKLKRSSSDIKTGNIKHLLDTGDLPEKLAKHNSRLEHKVCQTLIDSRLFVKSETIQKQLEVSLTDLDQKCKEMEMLCQHLKREKEQLAHQLISEKETVKFLRIQMEDYQTERVTTESTKLTQLEKENNTLHAQLKLLQMHNDVQQYPPMNELRNLLQEVQKQNEKCQQENILLRHNLTIANMEKEKHLAILSIRDSQIKDIVSEMNQLQEVVNEELMEFQKTPLLSQQSSDSTVLTNWQRVQNESAFNNRKEMGDNAMFPTKNTSINQLLFSNGDTGGFSFQELRSFDSSTSTLGLNDLKRIPDCEVPCKLGNINDL